MDRMIYLSMSGAKAAMQRQEVLANNLANVSTVGFGPSWRRFARYRSRAAALSTRVYALESTVGANHQPGVVQATGRNLDVAMQGNAWLAVQGLDGTEGYTRAGALEVNAEGQLMTKGGHTVLGDGGPITIPADSEVIIAGDGTVSAKFRERPPCRGRPPEAGGAGVARCVDARVRWLVPCPERIAGGCVGAPARRGLGRLERERGRDHGGDDRRRAAVRASMKLLQTAERQEQAAAKLLSANGV